MRTQGEDFGADFVAVACQGAQLRVRYRLGKRSGSFAHEDIARAFAQIHLHARRVARARACASMAGGGVNANHGLAGRRGAGGRAPYAGAAGPAIRAAKPPVLVMNSRYSTLARGKRHPHLRGLGASLVTGLQHRSPGGGHPGRPVPCRCRQAAGVVGAGAGFVAQHPQHAGAGAGRANHTIACPWPRVHASGLPSSASTLCHARSGGGGNPE